MKNFLSNIFTARDNISYSLTKLVGISAAVAMVAQFIRTGSVDFIGFAAGIGAIMVSLAVKYYVEDKEPK